MHDIPLLDRFQGFLGAPQGIDSGDTAWVLASAALVMIMTPGVGFFYRSIGVLRGAGCCLDLHADTQQRRNLSYREA